MSNQVPLLIGGQWRIGNGKATGPVYNPSTGQVIAQVVPGVAEAAVDGESSGPVCGVVAEGVGDAVGGGVAAQPRATKSPAMASAHLTLSTLRDRCAPGKTSPGPRRRAC